MRRFYDLEQSHCSENLQPKQQFPCAVNQDRIRPTDVKRRLQMRRCYLILIIVFAVIACQPAVKSPVADKVVQLQDITLRYQPGELKTETPLELTIETPADWLLVKAQLVGISMDMLTMPLFFRQQTAELAAVATAPLVLHPAQPAAVMAVTPSAAGKPATTLWQTQFLLGACADPQMRWRLELQFRDQKGTEHTRQDEFVVNRS